MKRIFALLLTLVMLFALLPAGAQADTAKATEKPFVTLNMGGTDGEEYSHLFSLPGTYTYPMNAETQTPKVHAYGVDDAVNIAPKMKADFDNRPDGARQFQLDLVNVAFHKKAESVVYFDSAVEMVKTWLTDFLQQYSAMGGKLDGIVVDLEYIESHAYYLKDYYTGGRKKTQNTNIYADIVNDPRYATEIRPILVEMGFEFYPNPSGEKSEIWTIYSGDKESYSSKSYAIWNHVMDMREREAINKAVLEPLLKFYPDAIVSDYQSGTYVAWEKNLDAHGNLRQYNLTSAGNVANFNAYSGRPESSYFNSGKQTTNNPPSFNDAIYEATPFSVTRFDVNLFKNIYASTTNGRINAWLGNYEYGRYEDGTLIDNGYKDVYSGTPYYSEVIYHIGMLDPSPFLGFIIGSKVNRDGFYMNESLTVTNDVMVELSRVAGYSDRKPIKTQSDWNGDYILSGMYAGGRNIWRITPDTSKVSVEDFKIKDRAPTFQVSGVTITFPQGRIIEDGTVSQAGSCGYWVETPTGVNPVITSYGDRYRYDPSYMEGFEQYATGAAFTDSMAQPKNCWEVSGSPTIETGATGNALALPSNSSVKLLKLPKNITAGDEYAKQQDWEVTVTLPSGFSGDVRLLQCGDTDGGFKLSGSKVYYDKSGSYQELSGVSLSAGTYILRRSVDFTGSTATCTYGVYDTNYNLIGEVKDVALSSAVVAPVESLSFAAYSTNGAVLLDDLNMYPTGTTTVLELYETKYGMELTDLNAARTEDTAYRLSWMNATGEYKVAYVYDSSTGNIIQKVEMGPGLDGVVTGVVKPGGKAVTIAVEVQTVTAPTSPNYDEGYFDWVPYGSSVDPSTGGGSAADGNGDGAEGDGSLGTVPSEPQGLLPGWTGPTEPSTDPAGGDVNKKRMDPGLIVLIICLSIVVLGGGGFALYWFVLKPKFAEKTKAPIAPDGDARMEETQVIPNMESVLPEADLSAETQVVKVEEVLEALETPEAEKSEE